jgi:hypothetical protein
MNRLAPLVPRAPARSGPARAWAVDPLPEILSRRADDARLFLTAFVGGLVFFGTFLG